MLQNMSGNFLQFDNAMEEFRRGSTDELSDHKMRTISEQCGIDVDDPATKGMLENFRIMPAQNMRLKVFK